MSNVVKLLGAEISRISRKEAKLAVDPIGKSHIALKKVVADLKGRVALLEKENNRLVSAMRKEKAEPHVKPSEEGEKARLTSKAIRSLRSRLGLSQSDFAKLLGVTGHSVHLWEKKEGALRLRDKTKAALLSIRGLGAREAKEKLAEAEMKSNTMRVSAPEKRKKR